MKILLITSSSKDRKRFSKMLSDYNEGSIPDNGQVSKYILWTVDDYKEAFEIFSKRHPDLVVISTSDRINDGKDLCQNIRRHEERRHTGIIFIAGTEAKGDIQPVECLEAGADDFITIQTSDREVLARFNVVLRMKSMTDELRSANHRLEILSLTDDLTGLSNMRSFNAQYAEMLEKCRVGQLGLGVIMMDLDHFKNVNDTANHLVGSYIISSVGRLMKHSGVMGKDACLARYGGDEYVVCMPATSVEEMFERAEAFRKIIEASAFEKDGYKFRVTCSIGVSWIEPFFDGKSDDPIKAADVMLYRSKEQGRNRVNAMVLRYPVDFHHVGRSHLVERDASSDDNSVPYRDDIKVFK
ncbi:MAG: diguanylate cyclase [Oligoflexales bacterium]